MSSKKRCWKLSAEVSDGQHPSVHDDSQSVLDAISEWLAEDHGGDSFSVEELYMTQRELDALPEL